MDKEKIREKLKDNPLAEELGLFHEPSDSEIDIIKQTAVEFYDTELTREQAVELDFEMAFLEFSCNEVQTAVMEEDFNEVMEGYIKRIKEK